MPDFKLWTSEAARRYLKRADYPDVARETIVEMNRQVGDLVCTRDGSLIRVVTLRLGFSSVAPEWRRDSAPERMTLQGSAHLVPMRSI